MDLEKTKGLSYRLKCNLSLYQSSAFVAIYCTSEVKRGRILSAKNRALDENVVYVVSVFSTVDIVISECT